MLIIHHNQPLYEEHHTNTGFALRTAWILYGMDYSRWKTLKPENRKLKVLNEWIRSAAAWTLDMCFILSRYVRHLTEIFDPSKRQFDLCVWPSMSWHCRDFFFLSKISIKMVYGKCSVLTGSPFSVLLNVFKNNTAKSF